MLQIMPTAYLLICCDLDFENEVVTQMKKFPDVIEVNRVFGVYDIVATITSDNTDKLRGLITLNINKIPKIRSVLTIVKNET